MVKKKGEISDFKAGKNKRKKSLSSMIMIVVIIFALVYFVVSAVKIINLNEEKKEADAYNQQLQEEKENLLAEYKNISSSEYMERLARRDLKLIKANELLFVLPESIAKGEIEEPQEEEPQQ